MKKSLFIFSLFVLLAICAIGEFYARLPRPAAKAHIEEIATPSPLTTGTVTFRAQNQKTKTVTTIYKSDLAPFAALEEMARNLEALGYEKIFATPSLVIMENSSGAVAALQAYTKDSETIAAAIVQQPR